jgi:hypothetical protein
VDEQVLAVDGPNFGTSAVVAPSSLLVTAVVDDAADVFIVEQSNLESLRSQPSLGRPGVL